MVSGYYFSLKQPALDVVKKRLTGVGLQDIIFDPKISGDKFEIYQSLERRLDPSVSNIRKSSDTKFKSLQKTIIESNDYKKLINKRQNIAIRLSTILFGSRAADHLSKFELPYYLEQPLSEVAETDIDP